MALTSGMNPNVVKTDLDYVFMQEFEKAPSMDYVDATSPSIFVQSTATNAAVQVETFQGITYWQTRGEEEDVHSSTPRFANKVTYNVLEYADSIDIPVTFFEDNMHGSYEMAIRNFAELARITRDRAAMKFWADGFATNTTADGAFIFSASHTTISGATVDNLDTAALSSTSLNTAIVALMQQQDHAGVVRGKRAKVLLVPPALYKNACELAESELRPNTQNNEPNVFLTKFGIYVATSPHLGATGSGVSGADAYWYLLADNHAMTRWVREGVNTDIVDYKYQRNNAYIYKGRFREVVGCQDYVGLYGSTGTT